ncbi:hypothetical protein BS78_01G082900 [Paspalum vaginatum]|nr:hypothetical protein BS78_01G082900 [Paspalum vaginatum]
MEEGGKEKERTCSPAMVTAERTPAGVERGCGAGACGGGRCSVHPYELESPTGDRARSKFEGVQSAMAPERKDGLTEAVASLIQESKPIYDDEQLVVI